MGLAIIAVLAFVAVAVFTPLGHVQKAAAYTTADCQAEYGQNFVIDSTGTTCEPSGYNNPEPDDGDIECTNVYTCQGALTQDNSGLDDDWWLGQYTIKLA